MAPQIYLMIALALTGPATYGVMWLKREVAVHHAYAEGLKAGKAQVAAATTAKSAEVVEDVQKGEAEAPVISPEKAKIIELCNRSASCRDRARKEISLAR